MATSSDSTLQFYSKASPCQWSYLLAIYKDVMYLKAQQNRGARKGGPEELMKLDTWYQETLPKNIHGRKDIYLTHEELVQVTKWKLQRGKARARLLDLVRINTELAVKQATTKAFKKLPNLSSAITALTNLKGIGPATASAVLVAGFPEHCPYMADECMLSTPGVEATDYTIAEYVVYAEQIKILCERINALDPEGKWSPHRIELALWTHYVAKSLKPALLDDMPGPDGSPKRRKVKEDTDVVSSSEVETNGKSLHDDDSNISAVSAVSVPASVPSEGEEKSNDSSLQNELAPRDETNDFRHPAAGNGNGNNHHDESDSKDGIVPSSEENSRNHLFLATEDNSNLSNSNLSSVDDRDVTTTTTTTMISGGDNNTNDSLKGPIILEHTALEAHEEDEPALKKLRAE